MPVTEICTAAQIPRRTFYNWWSHYHPSNLRRDSGGGYLNQASDRLVSSQDSWTPTQTRRIYRSYDRLSNPLQVKPEQASPETQSQTKLHQVGAEVRQQSMAIRLEACRVEMAYHHPRRPQPIRNRIPDIQRGNSRERDTAT